MDGNHANREPVISRSPYTDMTIALSANDKTILAASATAHSCAATLLLSCHVACLGLSFMGHRGGAHLGYDDEWHISKAGIAGIDFEAPLGTFEKVGSWSSPVYQAIT